jgi:hypothetical protein|tara:strand:+ start:9128 stop:9334 length:207 start_codon:yes stop_codon:yes gene_type:complete
LRPYGFPDCGVDLINGPKFKKVKPGLAGFVIVTVKAVVFQKRFGSALKSARNRFARYVGFGIKVNGST